MASRQQSVSIDLAETNLPGTPPSGFNRISAKPDGSVVSVDSTGNEIKMNILSFVPETISGRTVYKMKVNL